MRKSESRLLTKFMMMMLMDTFLQASVHLQGMVLITGTILYFFSGLLNTITLSSSVAIIVGEAIEIDPDTRN
jgi:hypothetical protein